MATLRVGWLVLLATFGCGPGNGNATGSADASGTSTDGDADSETSETSTTTGGAVDCSESALPAPFCHTRQVVFEDGIDKVAFVRPTSEGAPLVVNAFSGDQVMLRDLAGNVLGMSTAPSSVDTRLLKGDFDGDGDGDIGVATPMQPLSLFSGDALASLGTIPPEPPVEEGSFDLAQAIPLDVDRDGASELLITHANTPLLELWSRASGEWSVAQSQEFLLCFDYDARACDIDGDGFDEALFLAHDCFKPEGDAYDPEFDLLTVFSGDRESGELRSRTVPLGQVASAFGCADIDGDGSEDVLAHRQHTWDTAVVHVADRAGGFAAPLVAALPPYPGEWLSVGETVLGGDIDRDGIGEFLLDIGGSDVGLAVADFEGDVLKAAFFLDPADRLHDVTDVNGDGVADLLAFHDGAEAAFVSISHSD